MKMRLLVIIFLISLVNLSYGKELLKKEKHRWLFSGVFGQVDLSSAKRGFQVFQEICSSCHSLKYINYSDLITPTKGLAKSKIGLGFSEQEIKEIVKKYQIMEYHEDHKLISRQARIDDAIAPSHPNKLAMAMNSNISSQDLSLIIKAKKDGANYVYSMLRAEPTKSSNINTMHPILTENAVTYQDGTKADITQMSIDVVNFLQWASEPEMMQRKSIGIKVMIYLTILTILLYIIKYRTWSKIR